MWNFFQSYFLMESQSFPVTLIYERFSFCYSLQSIENVYYLFYWSDSLLLFYLLSRRENLYMTHYDLDLFYDIYNTMNGHNRRQTRYLPWILNHFGIYFWLNQNVLLYKFICFIINYDFYVIIFWMHYILFLIICGRNKVICYC